MTTVAVTGAGGYTAGPLLARLEADASVTRILAVDVVEPQMPPGKLEFRAADIRDSLLAVALDGADVVVHLAMTPGPSPAEDTMFAVNVHGTRNLLEAVSKSGARRLVHVSSGAVYGAHAENPVPLTEDAPLRANADFSWAYHHLLAEELVAEFAAGHPDTTVVVLRPVTTLGPGIGNFVAHHFEQPVLPLVRGLGPPVQLLHVDDLAAAIHLAVTGDLRGPYNVAPDGWLSVRELARLAGKPTVE
ncbi:MAG: NAD-dependent epimerase/dehydratase family protein, partial [Egibacteraceae bacterium]